jgi:hypothetical protein
MKRILMFPVLAAVLLSGGCFFASPQDVTYYDLSLPSDLAVTGIQVAFSEFENLSGAGARMRYRINGNQQLMDNLNKWAGAPDKMVHQYLLLSLTGSTSELKPRKTLTVHGRLEVFELNLNKQEAVMQFSYMIEGGTYQPPVKWQTVRSVVPLNETTPVEFARAFSESAEQVAKSIRNDILNHYQTTLR